MPDLSKYMNQGRPLTPSMSPINGAPVPGNTGIVPPHLRTSSVPLPVNTGQWGANGAVRPRVQSAIDSFQQANPGVQIPEFSNNMQAREWLRANHPQFQHPDLGVSTGGGLQNRFPLVEQPHSLLNGGGLQAAVAATANPTPGAATSTPANSWQPNQAAPVGGPQYPANSGVVAPPNAPPQQFGSGNVVQDFMTQFTANNSPYIQQARQSGVDMANSRGLLNSSIAGGNAVREAIKAAQPLVSEATGLLKSREGYAAQDWINSNTFNREFSGALALLPVKSSLDMLNTLMSYGAENPQIYTPEVMSGYSNFFQQNMMDVMSHYYGGLGG